MGCIKVNKYYIKYYLKSDISTTYADAIFAESLSDAQNRFCNSNTSARSAGAENYLNQIIKTDSISNARTGVTYYISGTQYFEIFYEDKETTELIINLRYPEATNVKYLLPNEFNSVYVDDNHKIIHTPLRRPKEDDSNDKGNGAWALILILALLILTMFAAIFPILATIYDYALIKVIKIKKLKKPSESYFNKFKLIFLICTIVYYAVFLLILLLNLKNVNEMLSALFQYCYYVGIPFMISYIIFYWRGIKKSPADDNEEDEKKDKKDNKKFSFKKNNKEQENKTANNKENNVVKTAPIAVVNNNDAETKQEVKQEQQAAKPQEVKQEAKPVQQDELDYDKEFEIIELLKQYKELLDMDAISIEEFNEKKKELLNLEEVK